MKSLGRGRNRDGHDPVAGRRDRRAPPRRARSTRRTIETTPILGRKFEDLLTLTPGVSVVQGPDGDEITFAGQRGVFNNISLDGGDYNNGFFGEQVGGQRAAIDITLEAVKEFQVVATGASAEFGRTAGGVVNVITKSGTNDVHGSLFHYQRLEGLTSNTSDGKPLDRFPSRAVRRHGRRPDRARTRRSTSSRSRASARICCGRTCRRRSARRARCSAPTLGANEALINGSADCQRLALLNFFQTTRGQDEGQPVKHTVNNNALLGEDATGTSVAGQQPVGLVQLRLLEEREPDLRRADLRQRPPTAPKGPSKINICQPQPVQHADRQQAERVPRHLLARESAALRHSVADSRRHRRSGSARRSASATRSSWRRTSTSW